MWCGFRLIGAAKLSERVAWPVTDYDAGSYRELMATHRDLARKLQQLEKKYDAKFSVVFEAIRKLMGPDEPPPSRQIGFQAKKE